MRKLQIGEYVNEEKIPTKEEVEKEILKYIKKQLEKIDKKTLTKEERRRKQKLKTNTDEW